MGAEAEERCPAASAAGSTSPSGLVHVPELVFLDEPTTGLDPQARANLWEHIRGLREERGTTVFLTTHYLDEADALCDRILVIDHGAIVASGTPDELKSQVGGDVLTVDRRPIRHRSPRRPGWSARCPAPRRPRSSTTGVVGGCRTAAPALVEPACASWTGRASRSRHREAPADAWTTSSCP